MRVVLVELERLKRNCQRSRWRALLAETDALIGKKLGRAVDAGLTRRTTYWYRVQAFNADGVSEYSNVIVARTL